MAKSNGNDPLDERSRKRLEEISAQWDNGFSWKYTNDKIDFPTLRLLLENFEPFQELIRAVCGKKSEINSRESSAVSSNSAAAVNLSAEELNEARLNAKALSQDLQSCNAVAEKLLAENRELQNSKRHLEAEIVQLQSELTQCQKKLIQTRFLPAELDLLRNDKSLAGRLDLTDWPENGQEALVCAVAVLSQRDNIVRLWNALKDRCEDERRPASIEEISLLKLAVAWFNINWPKRPYQVETPERPAVYDYERHLRSKNTPAGDFVAATLLPGVIDGVGKVVCKSLLTFK